MTQRPALLLIVLSAAALHLATATQAGAQSTPRTEWGDPDLRGLWNNATVTPMERPADFGDRTHLTEEEAEALRGSGLDAILNRVANTAEAKTTGELNETFLEPGQDVVRSLRTSIVVDPENGKIPYLPEGRRRDTAARLRLAGITSFDSHEDFHMVARCLWAGGFYFPVAFYLQNHRIVQTPDYVAILSENGPQTRIVPLDGRPRLPQGLRQWNGSSRGRWDGDTLVIETSNFNGRNPFYGSTEELLLVERLTLHDENTIDHSLTVSDPNSYAQPWTMENTIRRTEGPMYEFACHEGNYGLPNTLAGARHEEKLAREEER